MKKILLLSLMLLTSCSDFSLLVSKDSIQSIGQNETKYDSINSMDIDKDGNIYLIDYTNSIKKITQNGNISEFLKLKVNKVKTDFISSLSVGYDNNIYLTGYQDKVVKVVSIDTKEVSNLGLSNDITELNDRESEIREIKFSKNKMYLYLGGDFLFERDDKGKIKKINFQKTYLSYFYVNKYTNDVYTIYNNSYNSLFYLPKRTYLFLIKDGKEIDLTQKYTTYPFLEASITNIFFDSQENMYIEYHYLDGVYSCIIKVSKEGKILNTYSTNKVSFGFPSLYRSANHSFIGIDETRKILYYIDQKSIYKLNIN